MNRPNKISPRPSPFPVNRPFKQGTAGGGNVFWRRVGAATIDLSLIVLTSIVVSLGTGTLLFANFLAAFAFFGVWFWINLQQRASPGKWILQLAQHDERGAAEPHRVLFIRFSITWLPLLALGFLGADPLAENLATLFWLVLVLWYLAILISLIATEGRRGLHDLVCGTVVYAHTRGQLSPLRLAGTLGSAVLVVAVSIFGVIEGNHSNVSSYSPSADHVPSTGREFAADEITEMYQPLVFEIQSQWEPKGGWWRGGEVTDGGEGSGFMFVNDSHHGLVVTNWHVVEPPAAMSGSPRYRLRRNKDEETMGRLVAKAIGDIDLALILIELDGSWSPSSAIIRPVSALRAGEVTVVLGNPLGMGISVTSGILSRIEDNQLLRTSTPITGGNSGGPLFVARDAQWAGIVTWGSVSEDIQNINFALPAEWILHDDIWEFLERDTTLVNRLLRQSQRNQP